MTSALPLSGFVDRGIETGISDQLLRCGERTAMGLGQKMGDGRGIESGDRVKDIQRNWDLVSATLGKTVRHLFEFRLEAFQDADLRAEDGFQVRRGEADGGSSCLDQELRRELGHAAPAGPGQDLEQGLRRGLKESLFRGEGGKQAERGGGEGVEEAEDLGENDP